MDTEIRLQFRSESSAKDFARLLVLIRDNGSTQLYISMLVALLADLLEIQHEKLDS